MFFQSACAYTILQETHRTPCVRMSDVVDPSIARLALSMLRPMRSLPIRLSYLCALLSNVTLIACVREGELVPIEVSPRLAARIAYVGSLPSRTHAAGRSASEAIEGTEGPNEGENPEEEPNPEGPPPAKSLATDRGAH